MILALGLVLAVAMVGWVATDAARRQRNWLAWALVVAIGGPIGMIVWLIARRSSPVAPGPLGVARTEVIPPGYYFVMGDRRNNSSDSRHWRYVPAKYILGRVAYRWWPTSTARAFQ